MSCNIIGPRKALEMLEAESTGFPRNMQWRHRPAAESEKPGLEGKRD